MSLVEPRNRALAERVEAATSPRHRHLLLAGLHVGVYAAAVALLPDGPARPDAARIAEHASLAGVPEPLWRPLTQVPAATGAARTAAYVAAVEALEAWLAAPVRPRTSP